MPVASLSQSARSPSRPLQPALPKSIAASGPPQSRRLRSNRQGRSPAEAPFRAARRKPRRRVRFEKSESFRRSSSVRRERPAHFRFLSLKRKRAIDVAYQIGQRQRQPARTSGPAERTRRASTNRESERI